MSLQELIRRTKLSEIIRALGGEVRRGRCSAFWRSGSNPNSVSVCDDRGVWRDHVTGDGGGVLALIQIVLGCSRGDAAKWLAAHHGAQLGDALPFDRKAWGQRRRQAEAVAAELADWRADQLRRLADERNRYWDTGRAAEKLGYELSTTKSKPTDETAWSWVWAHCRDIEIGDAINREIERLECLRPAEVAAERAGKVAA